MIPDAGALLARARALGPLPTAVVHPVTASALEAAAQAKAAGVIAPVLVGPQAKIRRAAEAAQVDLAGWALIDAEHSHEAAVTACTRLAAGEVRALLKGSLHTDELLAAVLAEPKARTGRRLSHAFLIEAPDHPQPFLVTDGAVNIEPTLEQTAGIVRNAVDLFKALAGPNAQPKVAALAAVETVNASMPATVEAAALSKMADRGQLGDCLLNGPRPAGPPGRHRAHAHPGHRRGRRTTSPASARPGPRSTSRRSCRPGESVIWCWTTRDTMDCSAEVDSGPR